MIYIPLRSSCSSPFQRDSYRTKNSAPANGNTRKGTVVYNKLCPCKGKYPKRDGYVQQTLPLEGEVPEGGRGILPITEQN